MFTRIVKMEFEIDTIPTFISNFETVKSNIRDFPGCQFLELYRDKNDPSIFFTYSRWETENDLENYRESDLFRAVWATTKKLFRSKPQAWSVDTLYTEN
ncbi:MAG: antibiotic biosynthesis monooxygenase [Flavobacteriaceae bacterium]|nr:antibiotic biosynthesis monooxygenase [Flavobacteriaceae bacterium]